MVWLRRFAIVVIFAGVAVAVVWTFFARPVSEAMFRIAVSTQNPLGDTRADGLHVFLCGTGSPLPDPSRSGSCLGVVAGDKAYVIDPGEGSVRKLSVMGFPMGAIDAVVLSHLHSDHIDGLGGILLQAWVLGGRDTPMPVYGPNGVERIVAGVNELFALDGGFRTAHHGESIANPPGYGAEAHVVELVPFKEISVLERDGVRIRATSVSHAPVDPAMGLRVDYGGRSMSFSGDTLYDKRFVGLSKGVDIMLHDAMQHRMVAVMQARVDALDPGGVGAQILTDITDYHASPEDAARAAQDADAETLVMTHIAPPLPSRLFYPAFLGDAPELYDGKIIVGEDGMIFSFEALN